MKVEISKQGIDNYLIFYDNRNKELNTQGLVDFIREYACEIESLAFEKSVPTNVKTCLQSYYEMLKHR